MTNEQLITALNAASESLNGIENIAIKMLLIYSAERIKELSNE